MCWPCWCTECCNCIVQNTLWCSSTFCVCFFGGNSIPTCTCFHLKHSRRFWHFSDHTCIHVVIWPMACHVYTCKCHNYLLHTLEANCAHLMFYILYNYLQLIRLLWGVLKSSLKLKEDNLSLVPWQVQKALLLVQQDTTAVTAPLQVKDLRSHHLGVGVASAHSSAS